MEKLEQSRTSNVVAWLVLAYLCTNPNAKDTAEGVEHWWLRRWGANIDEADVQDALDYLVGQDWTTVRGSLSGHRLYSLNQTRTIELQQLLGSSE